MMMPDQMGASGPVSWARLTERDLATMVHWLNGALHVYKLLSMRPPA